LYKSLITATLKKYIYKNKLVPIKIALYKSNYFFVKVYIKCKQSDITNICARILLFYPYITH